VKQLTTELQISTQVSTKCRRCHKTIHRRGLRQQ